MLFLILTKNLTSLPVLVAEGGGKKKLYLLAHRQIGERGEALSQPPEKKEKKSFLSKKKS